MIYYLHAHINLFNTVTRCNSDAFVVHSLKHANICVTIFFYSSIWRNTRPTILAAVTLIRRLILLISRNQESWWFTVIFPPYKDGYTGALMKRSENKLDLPLKLERAVHPSRDEKIRTVRHLSMPEHVPPPGSRLAAEVQPMHQPRRLGAFARTYGKI